jgi:hypothetical protein
MRAKDALCGLVIGDKSMWEGSVTESMKDEVQEFESLVQDDPLARKDPTAVRKFDEARQTFVARIQTGDAYSSARRGVLPAGVNTKTWFDDDHAWSYGMSVYVPSLTKVADGTRDDMRSSILDRTRDAGSGSSGFTDEEKGDAVKRSGKDVKQGPTGRISPDDL